MPDQPPTAPTPPEVKPAAPTPPPPMRRFGDHASARTALFNNALKAAQSIPAAENSRYRMELGDIGYSGKEHFTPTDEKNAILSGQTLARQLKGTVKLVDKATGQPVDSKRTTLAHVPYLTDRGVFVLDGNQYILSSQLRLDPGIYTRRKSNDDAESHVNVPGSGVSHRIRLDPKTGVFKVEVGQAEIPAAALLKAMGASAQEMAAAWGGDDRAKALVADNLKAAKPHHLDALYERMGPSGPPPEDKAEALRAAFAKYKFDPWVNSRTMGHPHESYTKEAALAATGKLLKIARGEAEPDDRDSLGYASVWAPEHLIADRVGKAGRLLNNALWQATNVSSLKRFQPGVLNQAVRSLFLGSGLGLGPEGSHAAEFVDHGARITKSGEGGLGRSADSFPRSSRNVSPSQLPFIDHTRASECWTGNAEVMTVGGWRRWDEVIEDDRLACWVDGVLEFHRPLKLHVSEYSGTLYGVRANQIEYLVTPDHRMWTQPLYMGSEWRWTTAEKTHDLTVRHQIAGHKAWEGDGAETFRVPKVEAVAAAVGDDESDISSRRKLGSSRLLQQDEYPIAPFAELVGWYLGEGSTRWREDRGRSNVYATVISQSRSVNQAKCDRISACLTELGLTHKYYDSLLGFLIPNKQLTAYCRQFGYSSDRWIPEEFLAAPREARQRLFEALLLAEGTKNRRGRYGTFNTTSLKLAEGFSRLAFSLGYSTKTSIYVDKRSESYLPMHLVTIHSRDVRQVRKAYQHKGQDFPSEYYTQEYTGKVYCATVPGGRLYCRYNGAGGFWSGNSESVGIDLRTAFGTQVGDDHRVYAPLRDAKTGKIVYKNPRDLADATVAFPGTDPNDAHVPAVSKGKMVFVPRDKADYVIPSFEQTFSPLSNLVPGKSGVKPQRASMGSRMIAQSLDLVNSEAPLVRSGVPGRKGVSFEELYGRHMGAVTVPHDKGPGRVAEVTPDALTVRYDDGTTSEHPLYTHMPTGRKSGLHSTPLVGVGDPVRPGQLLAKSNYTDDKGHAAYGANARVAMVPFIKPEKGLATYEDSVAVSRSAAESKFKSNHYYTHDLPHDDDLIPSRAAYLAAFPGRHTLETLKKYEADGTPKVGATVNAGDPVLMAVRRRQDGYGLSRSSKSGLADASVTWDHDEPGVVTDVVRSPRGTKVVVNTTKPMKDGDKLCYSADTEVLTESGWKNVADVTGADRAAALTAGGELVYVDVKAAHAYHHEGRMYSLSTTQVDLLVTPDHHLYAEPRGCDGYDFVTASALFGKRYRLKTSADAWAGEDAETILVPDTAYTRKAGRGGKGVLAVPAIRMSADTYAMLLGIYLTDGFAIYQPSCGNYGLGISQIKPTHRDRLRAALEAAGLRFMEQPDKFTIYSRGLVEHFRTIGKGPAKHIPAFAFRWSRRLQTVLFDWMNWGNGSSSGPLSFTTGSKRLADDYQRLCLHVGYAARVHHSPPEKRPDSVKGVLVKTKSSVYVVYVYRDKTRPEINHGHVKTQGGQREEWVDYAGPVYCVTLVAHHVLYVRRNGRAVWCGNSGRYGNKGVVQIIPDEEMPQDKQGRPFDVVMSSMGTVSRINPTALVELALGKAAEKHGKPYVLHDFEDIGNLAQFAHRELLKHGLKDKEGIVDPTTGREIPNVATGNMYLMKLSHMSEAKVKGRGLGAYDESGAPLRGQSGKALRMSMGDVQAALGHGSVALLNDLKAFRGQANNDFWMAYMAGYPPTPPTVNQPYERFLTLLKGAGINPVRDGRKVRLKALTDADVNELARDREVKNAETVDLGRDGRPVPGGLFDEAIVGAPDKGYFSKFTLHEPYLNPVFEEPARRLLGLTVNKFRDVIAGREKLGDDTGMQAIRRRLSAVDVDDELKKARDAISGNRKTARDEAVRRLVYLKGLKATDTHPRDWFLSAVPVLPPAFRPVRPAQGGKTSLVSDANMVYRDAFELNKAIKDLHGKVGDLGAEKLALYDAFKAVTGLGDPVSQKNVERGVRGVLGEVLGSGSGKTSIVQTRLLGGPADLSGRGVVIPDPGLGMDHVGVPEEMAWDVFQPFVVRRLVRQGVPRVQALKMAQERIPQARQALNDEMGERVMTMTRYPALHKYNTMAMRPRLVPGTSIRVSPLVTKAYAMDFDGDWQLNSVYLLRKIGVHGKFPEVPENFWRTTDVTARFKATALYQEGYSYHLVNLEDFPHGELSHTTSKGANFYHVPDGILVLAYDQVERRVTPAAVRFWSKHPAVEIETVTLSSGRQIVTDDDPRAVYGVDPTTMDFVRRRPTEAGELMVPRLRDTGRAVGGVKEIPYRTAHGDETVIPLSPEFGYLCGVMIGNGWVSDGASGPKQISLACTDPGVEAEFRRAINILLGAVHVGSKTIREGPDATGFGASARITLSKSWVARVLAELTGRRAANKHLPPFYLAGDEAFRRGLVSGLMDTDGSVSVSGGKGKPQTMTGYTSASIRLVQEIQHLLVSLGVSSGITTTRTPKGDPFWVLPISAPDLQRVGLELHHSKKKEVWASAPSASTTVGGYAANNMVPFPRAVAPKLRDAVRESQGVSPLYHAVVKSTKSGRVSRAQAGLLVSVVGDRLVDDPYWTKFVKLVQDDSVVWDHVVGHEKCGILESGFDLTVPGRETFAAGDGVILSNTVSMHVILDPKAVKDAEEKMLPSRNLVSPANMHSPNYAPNMEFVAGLYALANQDAKNPPRVFRTKEDMLRAYAEGRIGHDTQVEILEK